jgi:hypothetical protein
MDAKIPIRVSGPEVAEVLAALRAQEPDGVAFRVEKDTDGLAVANEVIVAVINGGAAAFGALVGAIAVIWAARVASRKKDDPSPKPQPIVIISTYDRDVRLTASDVAGTQLPPADSITGIRLTTGDA